MSLHLLSSLLVGIGIASLLMGWCLLRALPHRIVGRLAAKFRTQEKRLLVVLGSGKSEEAEGESISGE